MIPNMGRKFFMNTTKNKMLPPGSYKATNEEKCCLNYHDLEVFTPLVLCIGTSFLWPKNYFRQEKN